MGHRWSDTVGVKPKYKQKGTCPNAILSTKEIPRGMRCDRKLTSMLYIIMHFVPHTKQQTMLLVSEV